MNCHECQELLLAHIEGLIDGPQAKDLTDHLTRCPACRQEELHLKTLRDRLNARGLDLAGGDLETSVLAGIVREQKHRLKADTNLKNPLPLRRRLMKNPITKIAAAAVVILGCFVGLSLFKQTSGVALADVLTRIEQIRAYLFQMTLTVTTQVTADQSMTQDIEGTILTAQGYGMKMTQTFKDPASGRSSTVEQYVLPQKKTMISLMPEHRQYTRIELDETLAERMKQQNYDPHAMISRVLQCDYQTLGRSTIHGIEAEGFQTTDPTYLAGMGAVDLTIWVDVKTSLPLRMDMDIQMKGKMSMHGEIHDFQWNVPVEASTFEPVIPDGWTDPIGGKIRMPALNEETAIEGLRRYAQLSGRYPKDLGLIDLMSDLKDLMQADTPAATQLREGFKDLDKDTITQKVLDVMLPIQGVAAFYMSLTQDAKDPAYYGRIVGPSDVSQVLLRWKVSDSEYRVIFGDLTAETVRPEVLEELEKALPKP